MCVVQVSDFSKCDGAKKYNRFHSSGVLIVWEWELYNYDEETEDETTAEEEEESSEDEVETESAVSSSHKLTFKCIGVTRAVEHRSTLRVVRDLMAEGRSVPVQLVHEPSNPRDSRALAFVCCINGERHTIGYVVSQLVEVHSAIDSGSVTSVEFAWVRYITDWSRSGPGFFAGIGIEKRGRWSDTAERYASTR